MQHTCKYRSNL